MYLTKQITNNDIEDKPSSTYSIEVPTKDGTTIETVEYKNIVEDVRIIKLGYCCEEKGVKSDTEYKQFKLNESGMFELDPVRYKDNPTKEKTHNVNVTGVKVPVGIEFTFDYVEVT